MSGPDADTPTFDDAIFRELYHSVNDAIFVHDAESGEILDANRTACEMYGHTCAEMREMSVDALSADRQPEEAKTAQERLNDAADGEPQVFDWLAKDSDGETFWVEVSMRQADIGDNPLIVVIARDISERKRAEQRLKDLTEEYGAVFENAADAIFLIDVDTTGSEVEFRFERLNPAHEATSGLTTEDIRGKTPNEVLGPELGSEVRENYRHCVEAREPITYEEVLPMPSGDIVWQTNLAPVIMDGEVTRIVGIARDITERKERERELERFHAFVENSTDVITLLDETGQPKYTSPAVQRILGYPPEEFEDESIFERIHPDDRKRVIDAFERVVEASDAVESVEFRLGHADGSSVWFESRARNRLDDSLIMGIVVNSRDITERKEYERKLERANEQLMVLNRIVRHDIRNDMNVAVGWSQELEGYVDREGQEILDRIQDTGDHVISLTKTVRDFVEAMGTDQQSTRQPVDLGEYLRDELQRRRSTFPDAEFSVVDEIPSVEVTADDLLSSVFRNLLNNAVQHNDSEEPQVDIAVKQAEDSVRVRIADNGPGISNGQKDAIFGRTEDGLDDPAAGIGLYLVDTLVSTYGGEVWVEDNEPRGAVFVVELPTHGR